MPPPVGYLTRAHCGVALLLLFITAGQAHASSLGTPERCTELAVADFSHIPDAPTQITQAALDHSIAGAPAFCRVRGYIAPQVGFEVRLPVGAWNGKFLHVGCGGVCGSIEVEQCDFAVRRGYACIVSDMGHTSTALDGKWGFNNLQGIIDFAYRATHVATLAGKAITARFYSQQPNRAYFVGCSQGGRQGLVEAQRFPSDYDGIIAGAPVIYKTLSSLHLLWAVQLTHGLDGAAVLPPEAVHQVHDAILRRCDAYDGLADGLIADPQSCRVDPAELTCRNGKTDHCLTPAQTEVVRKLYGGVRNSKGESLYWGVTPGSELNWPRILSTVPGTPRSPDAFATDHFRYLAFMPAPGPDWQPGDLDTDRDSHRFDLMESLYTAANPDLRRFKAAGGKLILYSGWGDPLIPPGSVVDYYETLTRTMGGQVAASSFARLFMLPGGDHCIAGAGADTIDYLSALEQWAEQGKAPEKLIGAHLRKPPGYAVHGTFPLDPDNIAFTRPVFPYPSWAKYRGKGDNSRAESFVPVTPPQPGLKTAGR
jgi:hypothetical protein